MMEPTVMNPKPKQASAPINSQFLSKPAASPIGFGSSIPAKRTRRRGSSMRQPPMAAAARHGADARSTERASAWLRSGESRNRSGRARDSEDDHVGGACQ